MTVPHLAQHLAAVERSARDLVALLEAGDSAQAHTKAERLYRHLRGLAAEVRGRAQ